MQQSEALEVELSGVISDATGTCPAKTFRFGSTVVAVTAATSFTQGACDDITDGRHVEIKVCARPTAAFSRVGCISKTMCLLRLAAMRDPRAGSWPGSGVNVRRFISRSAT